MKVNIELLPGGKMPTKAHQSDAGFDLYANITEPIYISPGSVKLIPVGFILELEDGWEAQIRSRSGLALKNKIQVYNSPGTIDASYRGEVGVILHNADQMGVFGGTLFEVTPGMKIAQMIIKEVPKIELVQVESVNKETVRQERGFGSSGI